ncbi:MAG: GDSL-type esterase/lipase family protein [Rubrivivax sp.]|nr:GDSL-type esterase/lipase family protein [Rubrivivax sp.]MDP3611315.1 GDSL-type esterase/lipase family protein [Rubrivivax sp.]
MPSVHRRHCLVALIGGVAVFTLPACSRKPIQGRPVAAGAKVLALGDSLTHGTGATPDTAFPAVLAGLTGWDVVNAGVPGHTSAQTLERAPGLLAEHQPSLVLLGIGGNDLLRRMDENQTRANIRQTVDTVKASGAQLLLIAVPRPTLAARFTGSLSDHPMYRELAEALQVPLHRQGWSDVLADDSLRADAIHANAAGHDKFARGLLATLRAAGLLV